MYIREIVISGRHNKKKKDWIVSRKHKIGSKDRRDLKNWPSKAKNLEESDFDVKPSLAPPKSADNCEKHFFRKTNPHFFFRRQFCFPAVQNFSFRPTAEKKFLTPKKKMRIFFSEKNVFRRFRQILEELGFTWRQNLIPRDFLLQMVNFSGLYDPWSHFSAFFVYL